MNVKTKQKKEQGEIFVLVLVDDEHYCKFLKINLIAHNLKFDLKAMNI